MDNEFNKKSVEIAAIMHSKTNVRSKRSSITQGHFFGSEQETKMQ